MKSYIFLLALAFISCSDEKKEKPVKSETIKEVIEAENYTLETQNFFIDIPKGYAVNEMKIANKAAMKDFIKSDTLQYYVIASEINHDKNTIDFNSNYIESDSSPKEINEVLFSNYKKKFPKESMEILVQKDTIIQDKNINYLVFNAGFKKNPTQSMYVTLSENNKKINMVFTSYNLSSKLNDNKTFWQIVESIGLK